MQDSHQNSSGSPKASGNNNWSGGSIAAIGVVSSWLALVALYVIALQAGLSGQESVSNACSFLFIPLLIIIAMMSTASWAYMQRTHQTTLLWIPVTSTILLAFIVYNLAL
jgi:hypothetical protein